MGAIGDAFKSIVSSIPGVGGILGKVFDVINIVKTLVQDIAQGKPFDEVLKDVAGQIAQLAIKSVIDYFTAGMGSAVLGQFVDKLAGNLGGIVSQFAGGILEKSVGVFSPALAQTLTDGFTKAASGFLTGDFRGELMNLVMGATGLKSENDVISGDMLRSPDFSSKMTGGLSSILFGRFRAEFPGPVMQYNADDSFRPSGT